MIPQDGSCSKVRSAALLDVAGVVLGETLREKNVCSHG